MSCCSTEQKNFTKLTWKPILNSFLPNSLSNFKQYFLIDFNHWRCKNRKNAYRFWSSVRPVLDSLFVMEYPITSISMKDEWEFITSYLYDCLEIGELNGKWIKLKILQRIIVFGKLVLASYFQWSFFPVTVFIVEKNMKLDWHLTVDQSPFFPSFWMGFDCWYPLSLSCYFEYWNYTLNRIECTCD